MLPESPRKIRAGGEIEQQETQNGSVEHGQQHHPHDVVKMEADQKQRDAHKKTDARREPVQSVHEIHGVHAAHEPEHGHGKPQQTKLQTASEGIADGVNAHPAGINNHCNKALSQKFPAGTEIKPVIQQSQNKCKGSSGENGQKLTGEMPEQVSNGGHRARQMPEQQHGYDNADVKCGSAQHGRADRMGFPNAVGMIHHTQSGSSRNGQTGRKHCGKQGHQGHQADRGHDRLPDMKAHFVPVNSRALTSSERLNMSSDFHADKILHGWLAILAEY